MRTTGFNHVVIALFAAQMACTAAEHSTENRLAGTYGTGGRGNELGTPLDVARYNWGLVCFGNAPGTPEYVQETLNPLLAINPDYKFVVRLWPTIGKVDHGGKQEHVTFLDYLYDDGTRKSLLGAMRQQVSAVMDHIDKPENVHGFCFQEELPVHFSDNLYQLRDGDPIPSATRHFQSQYEAETGRTMTVVDASVRAWWGRKFVEAMNDINRNIKAYSGGKDVFLYLMMGNIETLDRYTDGKVPPSTILMPCSFKDMILPGTCDGYFLYPGSTWDFYVDLAKQNNWKFFSQLSYTGNMRLYSWKKSIEMVNVDTPLNLGYFLFVWSESSKDWNADASMPEADSPPVRSPQKLRRIADQLGVGRRIVQEHLTPRVYAHYDSVTKAHGHFLLNVIVENPRDASWYPYSPDMAVLKNVRMRLVPPEGYLKTSSSPIIGEWLDVGDIPAGDYRQILYWPYKTEGIGQIGADRPFRIETVCDNALGRTLTFDTPQSEWPYGMTNEVNTTQAVLPLQIPAAHPFVGHARTGLEVEMRGVGEICPMPTLAHGDGRGKIVYNGCLYKGQTLIVHPDGKAELDGKDVSSSVYVSPISLSDYRLNLLTYSDSGQNSRQPKMVIVFRLVDQKVDK